MRWVATQSTPAKSALGNMNYSSPSSVSFLCTDLFFLLICNIFLCLPKESMGFEPGRGLGRYGQGRQDIIEASQQRGRRGLGFRVEGFDDKDFTWEEEEEVHLLLSFFFIF